MPIKDLAKRTAYSKKYREDNKDYFIEYEKNRWATRSESRKEYQKEYRQSKLEYFKEYDRTRIRDPEKVKIWRANEKSRITPEKSMWTAAKHRAKKKNLEFSIEISDIKIPEFCPILNIKLENNKGTAGPRYSSPTLDRRNNNFGYTPNNIAVISHKANGCKSDLTKQEIENLWRYVNDE